MGLDKRSINLYKHNHYFLIGRVHNFVCLDFHKKVSSIELATRSTLRDMRYEI